MQHYKHQTLFKKVKGEFVFSSHWWQNKTHFKYVLKAASHLLFLVRIPIQGEFNNPSKRLSAPLCWLENNGPLNGIILWLGCFRWDRGKHLKWIQNLSLVIWFHDGFNKNFKIMQETMFYLKSRRSFLYICTILSCLNWHTFKHLVIQWWW